jgi:hypothetical protein
MLKCPELNAIRLSSAPDSFLVGGEKETHVYNKNLSDEGGRRMKPVIWEVDHANGHIYYLWGTLRKTDFKLQLQDNFPKSEACPLFEEKHHVLGLSPSTETALIALGAGSGFYNYATNSVSEPFCTGRIIGTRPAAKWYCYDYCPEKDRITLQDVSAELKTMLRWQKVISIRNDRRQQTVMKLVRQICFGYAHDEKERKKEKQQVKESAKAQRRR